MKYKGAPLHMHKMMKLQLSLDKACIQSLIRSYEEPPLFITSVEALYA